MDDTRLQWFAGSVIGLIMLGLIVALLMVGFTVGKKVGYKQGQIDGLNGDWSWSKHSVERSEYWNIEKTTQPKPKGEK